MRQCWQGDSRERPTFPDIVTRIGRRLRQIAASNYDYVDAVDDYYVRIQCSSDDFILFTVLFRARHGGRLI